MLSLPPTRYAAGHFCFRNLLLQFALYFFAKRQKKEKTGRKKKKACVSYTVAEKNAKTGGKGGLMAMDGTAGTDGGIAGVAEWLTQREEQLLGPYAARSADSRGRARPQAPSR